MPKFVMSDARAFTNYHPNCSINAFIQQKYNLNNSHEYRYFLQQNAEKIMADLLAECGEGKECVQCPVCKEALNYKPSGKQ